MIARTIITCTACTIERTLYDMCILGMEHFSNTTGTEQTEQIQSQIEDVKGIMVENVGTNTVTSLGY